VLWDSHWTPNYESQASVPDFLFGKYTVKIGRDTPTGTTLKDLDSGERAGQKEIAVRL